MHSGQIPNVYVIISFKNGVDGQGSSPKRETAII